MNDIIKIDSNVANDFLRIELFLSNMCNFKCWYCYPGSNEGTHHWPKLESIVENLSYLLDYYKKHAGKKKFLLHIIGGEPTLWKDLGEFVKHFKTTYDCTISISTNGSRTIRWWKEYAEYFDHIMVSCHHEQIDVEHTITVCDLLYDKKVNFTAMVLMDPFAWDKCIGIVEHLKTSKHRWCIDALEVLHSTIKYTPEQKEYISSSLKRYPNVFWWLKTTKRYKSIKKTTVYFDNSKSKNVPTNWLTLNKFNHFFGWECNIGVDTFFINKIGHLTGACGQLLYGQDFYYNIFDKDFSEKFKPKIQPVICSKTDCLCQPEVNTSKHRIVSSKKIIPIALL